MVRFKWFGHSMWSIETEEKRIIIDPFSDIGYKLPTNLTADIVISSHDHHDHNNFKLFLPPFQKITQIGTYQIQDIRIKLIEASHGRFNGKNLGDIYMSLIFVDGISVLHCGDLGVIPNEETIADIADIDVIMVPIGGNYTLNAQTAYDFISLIKPKYVFPMHYKTSKIEIDIEPIDDFKSIVPNLEEIDSNVFNLDKKDLTEANTRFIKLNYE
ncbi:MAG: MBL fold metallo-hydrolase [Candidatus Cloacimonetes bacterium]|nr:MBL fold metallo-hydrolase [Candidatus Cloacimonadota bacterium]